MQINNITDVTNGTSVLKLSFNVDRTMDNVKAQVTYVGYSASVGDLSYTEKGDGSTTFNLPNLQGKLTGNNGTITMNYIIKY